MKRWRLILEIYYPHIICVTLWVIVAIIMCALASCSSTKDVPIKIEKHTEYVTLTDTIRTHDSIRIEHTTMIRELDSVAMAEYGIQLQDGIKKAWLVERHTLEEKLRELQEKKESEVAKTDSVPYPIYIEKQLTATQKFKIKYFNAIFGLLLLCLCIIFLRVRS